MKKLFAAVLVPLLLLTGCGSEEAAPTESQLSTDAITQPTETAGTLTEPATSPTETLEETISLPDVLVSDAKRETLEYNSKELIYAIPKVNLKTEDAEAWNQAIYLEYSPVFMETQLPMIDGLDYSFWSNGNYLTIELSVKKQSTKTALSRYAVFRLSDGSLIGNEELLADFAGSEAASHTGEIIEKNWAAHYDLLYAANGADPAQRARTLLWDNLRNVVLYPDANGNLVSAGTMFAPDERGGSAALVPILDYTWTEEPWQAPKDASAESLVTVFREEQVSYTDSVGNSYDITMRVPQLQIPGAMAENCNAFFQGALNSSVEEVLRAAKEGNSSALSEMDFKAWTWGRNLTLFVWSGSNFGFTNYWVYTFDLDTGKILDNQSVAQKLGMENWQQRMARTAEAYFDENYSMAQEEPLLNYQKGRTLSSVNLTDTAIFPDDSGAVKLLCKVYSVAGADYYWHCLDLTEAN